MKHPCRKVVLKHEDEILLGKLREKSRLSFDEVLEITKWNKLFAKKRLTSLHKEKLLFFKKAYVLSTT